MCVLPTKEEEDCRKWVIGGGKDDVNNLVSSERVNEGERERVKRKQIVFGFLVSTKERSE